MTPYVIDTNVLAVANGRHEDASKECAAKCVRFLLEVKRTGLVVLDDRRRIMTEYAGNLRQGGQPRTGWQFYKWLRDHSSGSRCRLVAITRLPGAIEDYAEFPRDPELAQFDPSDRKFVAVALGSNVCPSIANATDSDWALSRSALERNGITVLQLCTDVCAPFEPPSPG